MGKGKDVVPRKRRPESKVEKQAKEKKKRAAAEAVEEAALAADRAEQPAANQKSPMVDFPSQASAPAELRSVPMKRVNAWSIIASANPSADAEIFERACAHVAAIKSRLSMAERLRLCELWDSTHTFKPG